MDRHGLTFFIIVRKSAMSAKQAVSEALSKRKGKSKAKVRIR
jgi:hypothetical protein